ncbi:hypothetical protein [Aquabacterium humicola]|uniref:hypothetical protein n=1 Tax=Aquabacterium humicola TaxID=3237377 RepID=UPI002543A75B|nr:hypothetical protein [Rubrivivax pictus]
MAFELIDDWRGRKRVPPAAAAVSPGAAKRPQGQAAGAVSAAAVPADGAAIESQLRALDLDILSVHCYEDVGYPWIQVSFENTISPAVALKIGDALAKAAGVETVYFNSLRPRAVYFLLAYAFDEPRELDASRYGETLREIRRAWGRSAG